MNADKKEEFNPKNEEHKERLLASLRQVYYANKRFQMVRAGVKLTRKNQKKILKKVDGFAYSTFNKFKKEFISK